MPRSRRTNRSQKSRNQTRIQNIANERTEEEQEIAHEKRRVSISRRLCASQSQEKIVRSTDALGRMYKVRIKV